MAWSRRWKRPARASIQLSGAHYVLSRSLSAIAEPPDKRVEPSCLPLAFPLILPPPLLPLLARSAQSLCRWPLGEPATGDSVPTAEGQRLYVLMFIGPKYTWAGLSGSSTARGATLILISTDFFGGNRGKVLTAAAGEAILGPWLGRVCQRPCPIGSRSMASCAASLGFPPRLTRVLSPCTGTFMGIMAPPVAW
jgi:hypothetical protein